MPAARRFLFVDRVLAHEPKRWMRAEHVIAPSYAAAGGPYRLLEALAQSAGWLIAASTGFERRGLPISITSVNLPAPVPRSATVLLESEMLTWREDSALARAWASVDGTLLAEITRGICALIPADRLDDPATMRSRFARLGKSGAARPPRTAPADGWPDPVALTDVERIESGQRAKARWHVDPGASFFPDHFPRFPVLPGAVQVQTLVGLAATLFATPRRHPVLVEFTEARFRGFVRPGEDVAIEATVVSEAGSQAVATAEGFVDGKRVVGIGEIRFRLDPLPG